MNNRYPDFKQLQSIPILVPQMALRQGAWECERILYNSAIRPVILTSGWDLRNVRGLHFEEQDWTRFGYDWTNRGLAVTGLRPATRIGGPR